MINLISISYVVLSIIALGYYSLSNKRQWFLSNNFLLGIIASIVLLIEFRKLIIALNSGYIYEVFAYARRVNGQWFYLRTTLIIVALILPILNLAKRFRRNHRLQYIILAMYFSLAVIYLININNTLIDPGWHTTISSDPNLVNHLSILLMGFVANFVILKLKLLPELKK